MALRKLKLAFRKKTRPQRRRVAGRSGGRLRSMRRPYNANKDYASVTEVVERTIDQAEGNYITHSLADFARARQVATNYRMYRCKKVEVEFVPYANVYAPGTAFPELYCQVDRTAGLINGAAIPLPTKEAMEAKGCMPIKLTSIVKRFYSPSVLRNENLYIQRRLVDGSGTTIPTQSVINNVGAVSSTPVFNKWYMTQHFGAPLTQSQNPNPTYPSQGEPSIDSMSLQWYGMTYFVDSPIVSSPPAAIGKVIIKVHWQFKAPLWPADGGITGSYQTGGNRTEGWSDNGVTPNQPAPETRVS